MLIKDVLCPIKILKNFLQMQCRTLSFNVSADCYYYFLKINILQQNCFVPSIRFNNFLFVDY